ncbi:MAG: hypothetical protein ACRD3P_11810, partial [Terriglobales bacterium]
FGLTTPIPVITQRLFNGSSWFPEIALLTPIFKQGPSDQVISSSVPPFHNPVKILSRPGNGAIPAKLVISQEK